MNIIIRRTGKIVAWIVAILILLLIIVFILPQTPFGRRIILGELIRTIERTTNGTLVVKEMKGNLWTGFVLNDVSLKLKTKTPYDSVDVLHADRVLAEYSILHYLRSNELGISSIVLEAPAIQFVRFKGDTLWNYQLLTKPVDPTQPPPRPFNQILDLKQLRIQNASLLVRDYNIERPEPKKIGSVDVKTKNINWKDALFTGIDLDGHAFIDGSRSQAVKVDQFRFTEERSGFFVHHFQFAGYLDSLQARIYNAQMVTGHSNVAFDFSLTPPNVSSEDVIGSMANDRVALRLEGPLISTAELKQFIPSLSFLSGTPGILLQAHGKVDTLMIDTLHLNLKSYGKINIAGNLTQVLKGEDLRMDLNLNASNLSNASVRAFVPGLGIPNLSSLGRVDIPSLHYAGQPLNFVARMNVRTTGAGNVNGKAALDLRGREMIYDADLVTEHLQIDRMIPGLNIASDLTANLNVRGHGTNYKTLGAELDVKTNAPSSIANYAFRYFNANGKIDNGVARIGAASFDMEGGPQAVIRSGMINFRNKTPIYALDASIRDLPISRFAPSFPAKGVLADIDANVEGVGFNLQSLHGSINAKLKNLRLNNYAFKDIELHTTLTGGGRASNIDLTSDLADVHIEGDYQLGDITNAIPARINALMAAIDQRYFPNGDSTFPSSQSCFDSLDVKFDAHIKDLRPLAVLIPKTILLSTGDITGTVTGCRNGGLNITAKSDTLSFFVRTRSFANDTLKSMVDSLGALVESAAPRIQLSQSAFRFEAKNWTANPHSILEDLQMHVEFLSDSALRFNKTILSRTKLLLDYDYRGLEFDASSVLNSSVGLRLEGDANFPSGNFTMKLDTITVALNKSLTLRNENPAHFTLEKGGGLILDTVAIVASSLDETLQSFQPRFSLAAKITGDSIEYAYLNSPYFRISAIQELLPAESKLKSTLSTMRGSLEPLNIRMNGSLAKPEITANVTFRNFSYSGLRLDTAFADLHYLDQRLFGSIALHVDTIDFLNNYYTLDNPVTLPASNNLKVEIESIPMLISFKQGPNYSRDSAAVLKLPVKASLVANRFPVDLVGPFIPSFSQLHGIADININVGGTQESINFGGSANISSGSFLLTANNLYYTFDGGVRFADNKLSLENIRLKNLPADDPEGEALLNGSFIFKGFSIQKLDLALSSDEIMILNNASRAAVGVIYGPLVIATGSSPLTFSGTPKNPILGGERTPSFVLIKNAFLTLPQSGGAASRTTGGIIYRKVYADVSMIPDTVRLNSAQNIAAKVGGPHLSIEDSLFPSSAMDVYSEDTAVSMNKPTSEVTSAFEKSFADRLRYNLRISLQGDTWLTINFTKLYGLLGEQLVAQLQSAEPISLRRGGDGQYHINGQIDVTQNSTLRFFKNFQISEGHIIFRDDISNPAVRLVAEYVGNHAAPPEEDVKAELTITGTLQSPELSMALYTRQQGQWIRRPGSADETQEDVIYFLASGYFKRELDPSAQANVLVSASKALGSQLTTSLLTSLFGTSLNNPIRNLSFEVGPSLSASRLKFTAAFRDITFKYAGSSLSSPWAADYTAELAFSKFTSLQGLKNLVASAELHTTDYTQSNALIQQPTFLTKFVYRFQLP